MVVRTDIDPLLPLEGNIAHFYPDQATPVPHGTGLQCWCDAEITYIMDADGSVALVVLDHQWIH